MTYTDPQTPPPVDDRSAGSRREHHARVVAALVAVVAIIAVAFMVTNQTAPIRTRPPSPRRVTWPR